MSPRQAQREQRRAQAGEGPGPTAGFLKPTVGTGKGLSCSMGFTPPCWPLEAPGFPGQGPPCSRLVSSRGTSGTTGAGSLAFVSCLCHPHSTKPGTQRSFQKCSGFIQPLFSLHLLSPPLLPKRLGVTGAHPHGASACGGVGQVARKQRAVWPGPLAPRGSSGSGLWGVRPKLYGQRQIIHSRYWFRPSGRSCSGRPPA